MISLKTSKFYSMKIKYTLLYFIMLTCCITAKSQQISKEDLIFLTPEWKGERFADGRPKVPDNLLDRLKLVTHEEAWAVLRNENYKHQYEDGWQIINPAAISRWTDHRDDDLYQLPGCMPTDRFRYQIIRSKIN